MQKGLVERIFEVDDKSFEALALDIFREQAICNDVFKQYINLLKIDVNAVDRIEKIPFLPISFFKTHQVYTSKDLPEKEFTSSGTTGQETSRHKVASLDLYKKSFLKGFKRVYGDPSNYNILGLLPSYAERKGSSLVYMVDKLISLSKKPHSGFFLYNYDELASTLNLLSKNNQPAILIGVTFALLDFADKHKLNAPNLIVMETGGMKGRRKELVRSEVHRIIQNAFGVDNVHSEYGMTELLSQAYSTGKGIFECPPWMRVLVRDPYDPFSLIGQNGSGALNIIDLANIYSCSFIQTDDLGRLVAPNKFEVLGRMDGSQLRGCNLLV